MAVMTSFGGGSHCTVLDSQKKKKDFQKSGAIMFKEKIQITSAYTKILAGIVENCTCILCIF